MLVGLFSNIVVQYGIYIEIAVFQELELRGLAQTTIHIHFAILPYV